MLNRLAWLMLLVAFSARAADSPAVADARAMMTSGDYAPALQKIAQALALKTPTATAIRYDLFMLKGECHLSLKQSNLAIEAWENAIKTAATDDQRAIALAHELLVKRSQQFAYQPKSPAGKPLAPIDILEANSRKRAFAALLADELALIDPKVKTAMKAKSLPPILEAIKATSALLGLELAATGETAKSHEMLKSLTEQTRKLLAGVIADMNKRVTAIDKEASVFIEFWYDAYVPIANTARVQRERAWRRKGLTDAQLKELQTLGTTCDQIPSAIETITQALKSEGKELAPFAEDATRTRKEIARVLDVDYQQVFHTPPKK